MKLTTKVGLQATLGVVIAWGVMSLIPIPKSYWCPLTVLVLFSSSKGQNQSRAVLRSMMTLFGGILATLSVYYFHLPFVVDILIIALITFFLFYFLTISYAWSIFFAIFCVVYLYVILINWNFQLLEWRIMETCIGAAIVLFISTIWSLKLKSRILDELDKSLSNLILLIKEMENALSNTHKTLTRITLHAALHKNMDSLYATLKTLRYENVFETLQLEQDKQIINFLEKILSRIDMVETIVLISSNHFNYEIIRNEMDKTISSLEMLSKKTSNYLKKNKRVIGTYSKFSEIFVNEKVNIGVEENLITRNLFEQIVLIREDLINIDETLKKAY